MNLVILAAGRGSRLGSRTTSVPKCLNLFRGKPILTHILESARRFKVIDKVIIVGGYRCDMLNGYGDLLVENVKWNLTGTFASMMAADEFISRQTSIICYSDIIFSDDFLQACITSQSEIFVPSNKNFLLSWEKRELNILEDLETFRRSANNLIDIGGQPKNIDEIQGQFSGIVRVSPKGWFKLKRVGLTSSDPMLDTTKLLSLALKSNIKIETEDVDAFWKEFDISSDFEI